MRWWRACLRRQPKIDEIERRLHRQVNLLQVSNASLCWRQHVWCSNHRPCLPQNYCVNEALLDFRRQQLYPTMTCLHAVCGRIKVIRKIHFSIYTTTLCKPTKAYKAYNLPWNKQIVAHQQTNYKQTNKLQTNYHETNKLPWNKQRSTHGNSLSTSKLSQ